MAKLIGTDPNQVPTNADLGTMAYQDYDALKALLLASGNRNLIINGAMQVAQRGTSFASPSNVYTLDRWFSTDNTGASVTVSQDSDAPDGFTNSAKITVNTADTSLATNSVCLLRQNIEGVNFSQCGFGSGSAKDVTISFWVKSSITGQYSVAINNAAYDRSYVAGYTISSANTWEYKSVKITGDTSGTWLNSFSIGAAVHFPVAVEAGKITSGGAWTSGFNYGVTGQVNFVGTTGATFQITGVQLEVGDTATPFEHRSYGDELQRCMRYYYRLYKTQAYQNIGNASMFDANNVYVTCHWPVVMRANPTVSLSSALDFNVTGNGADLAATGYSVGHASPFNAQINLNRAGLTNGYAYWVRMAGGGEDVSKFLQADAEL